LNGPKTKYAKSGDVSLAYQVVGDGPVDLVIVGGFLTHVELAWDMPPLARFLTRLASFSRLILFDKRGTGLSDPVIDVPTLETRMDDVRAVMDAAGSERASLLGLSEGGPMCILFSASVPQRTTSLILCGAMARSTEAEDYPFGAPAEALFEASVRFIAPHWGEGLGIETFAPTLDGDPKAIEWWGKMERFGASPAMAVKLFEMFLDIDVRAVLPSIQVPTLVLHRLGDRVVNWRAGKWLAEHIDGARYVEFPGDDHVPWAGDQDPLLDEIEEFITGVRSVAEPDRVLATVLIPDIVDSTKAASELGDRRWRETLDAHDALVARELERHRGRMVKATGDGVLATFDGPARAIRCAEAISKEAQSLRIAVRAGLHAGECEVRGEDIGGIAVHIGARVVALAGPGEVLVSSTVRDLVGGSGIEFDDRGMHELKGVPGEWHIFSVVGA
jgi:class 3 adenylate cyclase